MFIKHFSLGVNRLANMVIVAFLVYVDLEKPSYLLVF